MIAACILSGLVGLVLGLLICYWKQITAVYENRDLISSGSNLLDAFEKFSGEVQKKL